MKNIWKYILVGIAVAIGVTIASDLAGDFFNGLGGYGFGCILGICMYLCVVIVTCTGIIVTELHKNAHAGEKNDNKSEL